MSDTIRRIREKELGEPLEFEEIRDLLINYSSDIDIGNGEHWYSDTNLGGGMEYSFRHIEEMEEAPEVFDIRAENFQVESDSPDSSEIPRFIPGEPYGDISTVVRYSFDMNLEADRPEIERALEEGDYDVLSRGWLSGLENRASSFLSGERDEFIDNYIGNNEGSIHVKGKVLLQDIRPWEVGTYGDIADNLARSPIRDIE